MRVCHLKEFSFLESFDPLQWRHNERDGVSNHLRLYLIVCSSADKREYQNSASLAFMCGIHRWPVNSLPKGPVTQKCFPSMTSSCYGIEESNSRVTLYTAGHLHTAVPHCSHSRAPIVHTAVLRENNEHGFVYLRCTAVCKLPGCVEGHPCNCSSIGIRKQVNWHLSWRICVSFDINSN